jgi:hypothetical protein
MRCMFDPVVLDMCKKAAEIVSGRNRMGGETYVLAPGISFYFYSSSTMLAPDCALVLKNEVPGLAAFAAEVRDIYYEFELCLDVFNWFNYNASLMAFRAYCPWIQTLVSDIPAETGNYREPNGLGPWIRKTRQAAGIMSKAALLRYGSERVRLNYVFTFSGFERDGVRVPGFDLAV